MLRRIHFRVPFNRVKKKVRGKNNCITYNKSILSSVKFKILGNNNKIEIGSNCYLKQVTFEIQGDNHSIIIRDNTKFLDSSEIVIEDNSCSLTIGNDCRFWGVHIALTESNSKIIIGDSCTFAYDIDLRTGDSHSIISIDSGKRINYAKDINIGNRVWIAAHNIILKGVNVADDSIVATGSIVTHIFQEKNVLIAGNPAKIIKRGVSWSRERID